MTPTVNFKSLIQNFDEFPFENFKLDSDLLIIDEKVLALQPEIKKRWKYIFSVTGGEDLKSLELFSENLHRLLQVWDQPLSRQSQIVACGGGSVGDFSGFVASVLKRGVELIHVPTTWLAAIDSAHGGKTALNVAGVKNQLGTFYPAKKVFLVKSFLATQGESQARDAFGELLKIALIDKNKMFLSLIDHAEKPANEIIWHFLKAAVEIKYDIVLQDPYETLGVRKILNLGHTVGHVLESYFKKTHGESVLQGLWFALEWSFYKKLLPQEEWIKILAVFRYLGLSRWTDQTDFKALDESIAQTLLVQDKKLTSDGEMDFIFLQALGSPKVLKVKITEIVSEMKRQGWIK